MRRVSVAPVPLRDALLHALRELKDSCLQRLLSAGASPADAERLIGNALEELQRTEPPMVVLPDFEKRFLRAVDRRCQTHAELRGLPYRAVAPLIGRHWSVLMDHSRRAGLDREVALRVLCDLIRKHASSWAAAENPGEAMLAQLTFGLHVIGLTKRGSQSA